MFFVSRPVLTQFKRAFALTLPAAAVVLSGCGNQYRPVVSAINPVGPSSQPTVYATALSDPGSGQNGLVTVVNVFGDTIIAQASVAPLPTYLGLDPNGQSYVLHSDSPLIDSFAAAPGLLTSNVRQSSLSSGANPGQVSPTSGTGAVFITEPGLSRVAVFTGGAPPTIRQELPVPSNPIYTVGLSTSPRVYTLSQGATPGVSVGTATAIENGTSNPISASLAVGVNPVYGVMTADSRRAFVVNAGGNGSGTTGTVSVINVQNNVLDTTFNVGQNPVWAAVAPAANELAVLNAGNGMSAGSLSVINIALCSQIALVGNAQCDSNNPSDSVNFGKTLATLPVGVAPSQVAVLSDLSKAYVANGDGTVTVIDMNSMVVVKTIKVGGKLNWIGAVAGSPTGKVLVTASDTQTLTLIRTDTDVIDTTLALQGKGISIRIAQ